MKRKSGDQSEQLELQIDCGFGSAVERQQMELWNNLQPLVQSNLSSIHSEIMIVRAKGGKQVELDLHCGSDPAQRDIVAERIAVELNAADYEAKCFRAGSRTKICVNWN